VIRSTGALKSGGVPHRDHRVPDLHLTVTEGAVVVDLPHPRLETEHRGQELERRPHVLVIEIGAEVGVFLAAVFDHLEAPSPG
jgi:hypothetical protein